MTRPLTILIVAALVLSSCGSIRDSRLNPFNWFGRGQVEQVTSGDEAVNPLIPRRRASIFSDREAPEFNGALVGEITELLIERRPGGAIMRATAVADRQGPFELTLVKIEEESDATTLTYEFRAYLQRGAVGSAWSRTVTAAQWLTDSELRGIQTIRVKGARNARVARR